VIALPVLSTMALILSTARMALMLVIFRGVHYVLMTLMPVMGDGLLVTVMFVRALMTVIPVLSTIALMSVISMMSMISEISVKSKMQVM
jgi:hypothetical protein